MTLLMRILQKRWRPKIDLLTRSSQTHQATTSGLLGGQWNMSIWKPRPSALMRALIVAKKRHQRTRRRRADGAKKERHLLQLCGSQGRSSRLKMIQTLTLRRQMSKFKVYRAKYLPNMATRTRNSALIASEASRSTPLTGTSPAAQIRRRGRSPR